MREHYTRAAMSQIRSAKVLLRHRRINRVRRKVRLLLIEGGIDAHVGVDVLLRAVLYANIAETHWYFLPHDHSLRICSSVHDVDLGDHTEGADALFIDLASHLQSITCSHVCVRRNNAEDDSSWVLNVAHGHLAGDLFDVLWLVRTH